MTSLSGIAKALTAKGTLSDLAGAPQTAWPVVNIEEEARLGTSSEVSASAVSTTGGSMRWGRAVAAAFST